MELALDCPAPGLRDLPSPLSSLPSPNARLPADATVHSSCYVSPASLGFWGKTSVTFFMSNSVSHALHGVSHGIPPKAQ